MKYILFFILLYSCRLSAQSSIYDLNVQSAGNKIISLSDFKGKKLLIAVVSTAILHQKNAISYLDSLQISNPGVVVIVIPANDIGTATDTSSKVSSLQTTNDKVTLTGIASAKKDKDAGQHPLLQWLTHVNKNTHFDADVETDSQLYVVSESGVLFAVLCKGAGQKVINDVLKQADIKY